MFGAGISFAYNDQTDDGSINETMSVESTDQGMYMKALVMPSFRQVDSKRMTQEGASEYYWSLLVEPLQR